MARTDALRNHGGCALLRRQGLAGSRPLMSGDFQTRIAEIRSRFGSSLEARIAETAALLPSLSGNAEVARTGVADTYVKIHGISGVALMVGFTSIGKLAGSVEEVLLAPYRAARGLTTEEAEQLGIALAQLLEAVGSAVRNRPQ